MAKPDWKNEIGSCFDDLRILEKCRAEVDAQFAHFYEFIAAPAFQGLAAEFKRHKVRCSFEVVKGRAFAAEVDPRAKPGALAPDSNAWASTAGKDPQAMPGAPSAAPAAVARYKRFVTEAALAPEGATEIP